jgi:pimeloyl-ACP methyl ester carboxylesterase
MKGVIENRKTRHNRVKFILVGLIIGAVLLQIKLITFRPVQDQVWTDCSTKETKLECATIQVPMDYDDPNSPKIKIALNKYTPPNATKFVLTNPGGPGGSGKQLIHNAGRRLSKIVDDQLIWVGFDPRGIGESTSVSCGTSFRSELALLSQAGSYLEGTSRDYIYDSIAKVIAEECRLHTGKLLQFMSTYYVAKDMDEIRKFLKMDTMRYWGFSYGSVLGNTYANMFPDKATNIVIDGVVDPRAYFGTTFDFLKTYFSKTTDALVELGRLCDTVSSNACALSRKGKSSYQRLMDLARKLEKDPVLVLDFEPPTVITTDLFLTAVQGILYTPVIWHMFADSVSKLEQGDASLFSKLFLGSGEDQCTITYPLGSPFSGTAVLCADTTPLGQVPLIQWKEMERTIRANFTADVGITGALGMLSCQYWNKNDDWKRFTGPWNHTFARPVVVVGTRFDPVTPWYEARDTVALMNQGHDQLNAVLLTHDGHGHCSISQFSSCSANYIKEFLVNDIVPPQNAYCQAETPVFPEDRSVLDQAISISIPFLNYHNDKWLF